MNYPTKLAYSLFSVMIWGFCILGLYYAFNFSYTTAFRGNLYGVGAIQYAIDAFMMMVLLFALTLFGLFGVKIKLSQKMPNAPLSDYRLGFYLLFFLKIYLDS